METVEYVSVIFVYILVCASLFDCILDRYEVSYTFQKIFMFCYTNFLLVYSSHFLRMLNVFLCVPLCNVIKDVV